MIYHARIRLYRLSVATLFAMFSLTGLSVTSQSAQSPDKLVAASGCNAMTGRESPFEANALWIKGKVLDHSGLRQLDPEKTTSDLRITYEEDVTVYVAYRCPKKNDEQWAKVSFRLSVERPDGSMSDPSEDQKEIIAGAGVIPPERAGRWAASHGRITFRFNKEDPSGMYIFRITVKDHVGNREVICTTKVHLR